MNAYRPEASHFRLVFGAAAVALMALTFGAAVVGPAAVAPEAPAAVASKSSAHVTEVAISPAVIEVILYRDRTAAVEPVNGATPAKRAAHPARAHVGTPWVPAAAADSDCPTALRTVSRSTHQI